MKRTIIIMAAVLLPALISAQSDSLKLMGPCMIDDLRKAPYADWFAENYDGYAPNPGVVERLKGENFDETHVTIFFGTWCGDSRREVPRFLKTLEAISFPLEQCKIIAIGDTDPYFRSAPGHEEVGRHIYRVPTFIISRDDEELGRIVEYPAVSLERDLLDIVQESSYIPNYPAYLIVGEWLDAGILHDSNVSYRGLANQLRHLTASASELNSLANTLLRREKTDPHAISMILRINCNLYPNVYWTYTKLAELLSNNEDKHDEAIEILQSGMENIKDPADIARMQELLETIMDKM
ncbi:MAG: thioredoxin family protein [Tannerellaceae bacterium]|nr:thioredoxin family protein [Tannerellaceae bacterium]